MFDFIGFFLPFFLNGSVDAETRYFSLIVTNSWWKKNTAMSIVWSTDSIELVLVCAENIAHDVLMIPLFVSCVDFKTFKKSIFPSLPIIDSFF